MHDTQEEITEVLEIEITPTTITKVPELLRYDRRNFKVTFPGVKIHSIFEKYPELANRVVSLDLTAHAFQDFLQNLPDNSKLHLGNLKSIHIEGYLIDLQIQMLKELKTKYNQGTLFPKRLEQVNFSTDCRNALFLIALFPNMTIDKMIIQGRNGISGPLLLGLEHNAANILRSNRVQINHLTIKPNMDGDADILVIIDMLRNDSAIGIFQSLALELTLDNEYHQAYKSMVQALKKLENSLLTGRPLTQAVDVKFLEPTKSSVFEDLKSVAPAVLLSWFTQNNESYLNQEQRQELKNLLESISKLCKEQKKSVAFSTNFSDYSADIKTQEILEKPQTFTPQAVASREDTHGAPAGVPEKKPRVQKKTT